SLARETVGKRSPDPLPDALRIRRMDRVPIHQNEGERPGRQNPSQSPTHAHESELFRVLHVRERNRVGDGNGGHIKQAMDQHQSKERPKRSGKSQADQRQSAYKLTERKKFLRRKMAVGELIAEEHADNRGHREGIKNERLL